MKAHVNIGVSFGQGHSAKGVHSISQCIKACVTAGGGIAQDNSLQGDISTVDILASPQVMYCIILLSFDV